MVQKGSQPTSDFPDLASVYTGVMFSLICDLITLCCFLYLRVIHLVLFAYCFFPLGKQLVNFSSFSQIQLKIHFILKIFKSSSYILVSPYFIHCTTQITTLRQAPPSPGGVRFLSVFVFSVFQQHQCRFEMPIEQNQVELCSFLITN